MVSWLLSLAVVASPQDTLVLGLDAAVARARIVSPAVASAEGRVRAPRGERAEAWLPFRENPTLEYASVRRRSPSSSLRDHEWSLSQEIEIAGQGFVRSSAAGKRVRAAEANVLNAHRVTALEARISYLRLVLAERRAALVDSTAAFAERLAGFARSQLEAGEINRLEYNAAVLEAPRQRSAAERARADLAAEQADLARLLALGPDSTPRTASLPDIPDLGMLDRSRILELARSRRADLASVNLQAAAADQDVTVTRLDLVPTLALTGFTGREEATDDLLGFSVGLRLPLFRRQQAATGAAQAERARARSDLATAERLVQADVRAVADRYERTRIASLRFAGEVLQAALDNVRLTEVAFAEGEVDVTEVIVLRGTAVAAQLEYLEVLQDAYGAWFQLAAVAAAEPDELSRLLNGGGE